MSTNNTPVHVLVDEMIVRKGPGPKAIELIRQRFVEMGEYAFNATHGKTHPGRVKLTLVTQASNRTFERWVIITKIEPEFESWEDALAAGRDPFDGPMAQTGRYKIKGYIGNWYFKGFYDPQSHKGLIEEDVIDPEEEAEELRIDGLEQEAIRRRGGL